VAVVFQAGGVGVAFQNVAVGAGDGGGDGEGVALLAAAEFGAEFGFGLAATEGPGVGREAGSVGIPAEDFVLDAAHDRGKVARAEFVAAAESVAELRLGPAGVEQAAAIEAKAVGVGIAVENIAIGRAKGTVGVPR